MSLPFLIASIAAPAMGSTPENPSPAPLWVNRYDGPAKGPDAAYSVASSPDGSKVFVTGVSFTSSNDYDYFTSAYSATTGSTLWTSRYAGPASQIDVPYTVAVSPDGSKVFVTGYSFAGTANGYYDYATVAYSATNGDQLWVARYDGPLGQSDYAFYVATSPDGSKVYVSGMSWGDHNDIVTVAYSAGTGAQIWVARYDGPGLYRDEPYSLAVSPDGSKVFVTGFALGTNHFYQFVTVAYSASSGDQLWASLYAEPGDNDIKAYSLAVSPDSSKVFVTGYRFGAGTEQYDYATVAYSADTGEKLWAAGYDGPSHYMDVPLSIGVSPDGSKVFVTGYSFGSLSPTSANDLYSDADYATLAYSAETGAQLWLARYNGPGSSDDVARALAVSPDGSKVYVTGASKGNSSPYDANDYATIAYSASTGFQVWTARYSGPGFSNDIANALALSRDGSKIFVTGYSKDDSATVAYRTNSCANGQNEIGPVSGPVSGLVEPQAGAAAPYVHGVNCDRVAPGGL